MDMQTFLNKTIPVTETGCWIWIGAVTAKGYGFFNKNKKRIKAHRHSFELFHQKEIGSMCVLHKCDVPSCVNPEHLFLGTQKDNMLDKKLKGRAHRPFGESNPSTKLTQEIVDQLRNLAKTLSMKELSMKYPDIPYSTMYAVVKDISWKSSSYGYYENQCKTGGKL